MTTIWKNIHLEKFQPYKDSTREKKLPKRSELQREKEAIWIVGLIQLGCENPHRYHLNIVDK